MLLCLVSRTSSTLISAYNQSCSLFSLRLQVTLHQWWCLNIVLVTNNLFSQQKSSNHTTLILSFLWPKVPIILGQPVLSIPTIALKSPKTINMSFLWFWLMMLCSVK
jgi:hypothetical protein